MLKHLFFILLILLSGCNNTQEQNSINHENDSDSVSAIQEYITTDTKEKDTALICDSLRFPDFKKNIIETEKKTTPEFDAVIDSLAQSFITQNCNDDSLYCGEIYLKFKKFYTAQNGYELYSYAYEYKSSGNGTDNESGNLYVFGYIHNGKLVFTDIVSDLMFGISLELNGFEVLNSGTVIWGKLFPYTDGAEHGKFKLTLDGGSKFYEYECE